MILIIISLAKVESDADLDAFVRAKSDSAYHPSCTCKMGDDDMAVVDNAGKVGVDDVLANFDNQGKRLNI